MVQGTGAVVTPLRGVAVADQVVRVHKKQQSLIKHGHSVKIDLVWLSVLTARAGDCDSVRG